MIVVEVKDRSPNEIIDIVKELKVTGLSVGKDFDFSYHPPEYDFMNGHTESKKTKFTFYNEKLATWFILKWA